MSLFERIKNIRYDLQEKKKFPGDESGAYKQAKDDLEARKGFSKNKPGGLKADEKNPYVKRSVRKSRVDKLGGDIYDQPKFTQKGFEKSLKDVEKLAKTPKYKRQSSYRYPLTDPFPASKGDTPGEIRVKGLDRKAFKKTKPSDIKLPKSFTDFQKNLQDYKDKDKATMRTGKSSSKVKVSGANNLSRQDVGMAPPDKPKVVKQSEVSKKAKAFTNQIAQQKKAKTNKVVDLATKKQQSKLSQTAKDLEKQTGKIDAAKQKLRSATGTKDVKKIRQLNVQGREYRKLTQATKKAASGVGNPNAPVKYNKMTAGADFIKKNRSKPITNTGLKNPPGMIDRRLYKGPVRNTNVKLPKVGTGITKSGNISFAKDPTKLGGMKLNKTTQAIVKRETSRALRRPENVKFAVAAAKRKGFARGATRLVGKLGPKGRIAAAGLSFVPTLLANPGVRNFVKNTALFGTAAAALGFAKPKQNVLKVGKGVTKTTNLPSKFQPKNAKNLSYVDAYGKKRKLESGDVRFKFGLTGTKPGGKPGGMQYNKQDMARVKNIQKKYIDSYNASVKGNPFKKQIKYSVNKDGSYTVTPPKKK